MRITVLGAGNIGRTLAGKWAGAGHEVVVGVRDPDSPRAQAARAAGRFAVETVAAAVPFGEAVLFAVPGMAVEAVLDLYAGEINGKTVIDATNKIGGLEMSAVSAITEKAPEARIFRAFNSLGWENFAEPVIGGDQADLFYCGPEEDAARQPVEGLIRDIGLRPVYLGGLDQVQVVDNLTRLWFALAVGQGMGRHLAFRVLAP